MTINNNSFDNIIERLDKNVIGLLLFFIVCMVIVRYSSFSKLVIGHDESTYLEIAREWFNGKTLYKDVIDIKPVGIYGVFGFLQFIGIKSIFGLRLTSSIFLGLGAFSLNRLVFRWSKNSLASLITGLVFVFLHSFYFSLDINTETYFTLFIVFGITLGVIGIDQENKIKLFLAGLLIGLAFIIKYLAIMEGLAFGVMILLGLKRDKGKSIALFVLGGIIPFAVVNVCFWLAGNWEAFYFVTYLAPFKYNASSNSSYVVIIERMVLFFLPVLVIVPLLYKANKKTLLLISIWLICSFIAILLPKKPFSHYWIQMFAPISVIVGFSFSVLQNKAKSVIILPIIILLVLIGVRVNKMNTHFAKADSAKEVIDYIVSIIKPSESFFCANFEQVAYYILKKDSPTPYIHKSILYRDSHQRTLAIDGKEELLKIIAQEPTYITVRGNYPVAWFQEYLNTNYVVLKKFGDIRVLKLCQKPNSL